MRDVGVNPVYVPLLASELVGILGERLIGRTVVTPSWVNVFGDGGYPGGAARVVKLTPDPNAPEIVFEVEHPCVGRMGIFEFEEVVLQP